jgi:hypothetical protein
MNLQTWEELDTQIKAAIFKNDLNADMILKEVYGELNELVIKTKYGTECLFYGNGEAFINVDVNDIDYHFCYVVDIYGDKKFIVNY